MKKDLHPEWYPEAKVICGGEVVMTVGSTRPELRVDIWSGNHPFYTGKQRLVDTAGQVDRFMKRLNQYSERQADASRREKEQAKKQEQRFAKQQLMALELNDRVFQILSEANVVTVGELEKKIKEDEQSLLELEGFSETDLEKTRSKVAAARQEFFAAQ